MATKMVALKATTYGTKRLGKGDVFMARDSDAPLLKKLRRAKPYTARAKVILAPPQPEARREIEEYASVEMLRQKYEQAFGVQPDRRWGMKRIKDAIGQVQVSDRP
jgi:hypothetical protein